MTEPSTSRPSRPEPTEPSGPSARRLTRRGLLGGGAAAGLGILAGGAPLTPAAAAASATSAARAGRVRTGFEVLHAGGYRELRGQKVGLISNPTGVVDDLRHAVDVMHESDDVELIAAFGPEHGFRGSAQAGGSEGDTEDPRTGLPVYDLYAKPVAKYAEYFTKSGIDTVLFDIQDVGARFYTYIWTMYNTMKASVISGTRVVVLDRPNPLGGKQATGPVLHPEHASGVGLDALCQQHGMTIGELARLFNAEFLTRDGGKPADLTVIRMTGWRRGQFFDETGVPWVLPSPNMPTLDTAFVYPGLGMFEGTNLSEGRGTTRPFETIGAPYVDWRWSDALNALDLPGVRFREAYYVPTFSKHQGQECAGVQTYVTDRASFDPIRTGVAMIVTAKRLYPNGFAWRESRPPFFIDKLTGNEQVRTDIDAGKDPDAVVAGWQGELSEFREMRSRYLLYR
jgi:uncharacterized protein YbbC (DUF1343 family)